MAPVSMAPLDAAVDSVMAPDASWADATPVVSSIAPPVLAADDPATTLTLPPVVTLSPTDRPIDPEIAAAPPVFAAPVLRVMAPEVPATSPVVDVMAPLSVVPVPVVKLTSPPRPLADAAVLRAMSPASFDDDAPDVTVTAPPAAAPAAVASRRPAARRGG